MTKDFPILYKYTNKGQIQQWQIVVERNTFYTIEGIKNGKLTTSLPTVCIEKNIGKANATTSSEQAWLEAKAKYKKKIDSGYSEELNPAQKFFIPMLAHEVELDSLDYTQEIYLQPKLDGVRAISKDNKLTSRNGKEFISCPHLYQNEVILDGELYSHEYRDDFNKIISLVKKTKLTPKDLDATKQKIKHYVYDFPEVKEVFSVRYKELKKWVSQFKNKKYIEIVPTILVKNKEEFHNAHEDFIQQGYEGTIVRLDKGPYEHKRSKQLLKYKDWQDAEFEILDVIEGEGNRTGTVGKFVLKLNSKETFESNIKGDIEYLSTLLKEKNKLKGKLATVKFFRYTPAGVPRFPYVIKINRIEYE